MSELLKQIEAEVKAGQVGEYNETAAKLAELKETYGTEVPQCETRDGYTRSKSIASECRTIRTALENKRKEIKAPALAFGKMIDSEAKRIKAEIELIETPHLNAYREVDEIKKAKKEAFEQKLQDIKNLPTVCMGMTSQQIVDQIDDLACVSIDKETFGHKLEDAEGWVPSILEQLSGLHAKAIEYEAEQARIEAERLELEVLRRQQAEREESERQAQIEAERIEHESKIAEQAKAQAIENEQRRQREEVERIEREKQQAIDNQLRAEREAKEAAERAEIEKQQAVEQEKQRQLAEQARIKAEEEAREADKAHRASINNAALQCFVNGGLTEKQAKLAVTLIASKQIDNVKISY